MRDKGLPQGYGTVSIDIQMDCRVRFWGSGDESSPSHQRLESNLPRIRKSVLLETALRLVRQRPNDPACPCWPDPRTPVAESFWVVRPTLT